MRKNFRLAAIGASLSLVATLFAGIVTAGSASAASSTITIGYIGDLTGVASSSFVDGPGAAKARIDALNAKGG